VSISSDDTIDRRDYGNSKPIWRSKNTSESVSHSRRDAFASNVSPMSVDSKRTSTKHSNRDRVDGLNQMSLTIDDGLSEEKEHIRFAQVGRKKDFAYIEMINGKPMNVLQGLELHTKVFNSEEQRRIVDYIFTLQRMGQKL
jgi:mRNA N6-methyladenine demethylase